MEVNKLTAISPVDGRYRSKVEQLDNFFSEFALIKYRIKVEIEYFIALSNEIEEIKTLEEREINILRAIYSDFSEAEAHRVKAIEAITNHDVKAVEYFIKEKLEGSTLEPFLEFIHFGLTSQDINNTAFPLMLKDAQNEVVVPVMSEMINKLSSLIKEYDDIPLLARTHGQPASPTRLGKEFQVFEERLSIQISELKKVAFTAKFGGATGNFNAHKVAYPSNNWVKFANDLVNKILGLSRSQTTTQIEHYDGLAQLFDNYARINSILIDLCRDIWTYISMDYFKQKIKKGEVGSSAMPHKVNPIDFENAEGNLGIANALYNHLSSKLPISRLQRDLTDSTVLRNVGIPIAHSIIAYKAILKGLNKLLVNKDKIHQDLEDNWIVLAEAIQTVLRREGFEKPYEALKALTRTNTKVTQQTIHDFIDGLEVSEAIKLELKEITPFNYTGI